ncbi:MAG: dihydroxyacetone kinase phosphoryl donor subunit DhaM [Clostridia bacterium]|nr:dihydroxyacetone kinase phosphoryl donor subunit DhaM [Clostridia bacterium]
MVGIVVISHSKKIAKSVEEFALYMAPKAKVVATGGTDEDKFGSSKKRIKKAITKLSNSKDGVIVIADMGSTVTTAREIIDSSDFSCDVQLVDCPLMEGTIVAAIEAQMKKDLPHIVEILEDIKTIPK